VKKFERKRQDVLFEEPKSTESKQDEYDCNTRKDKEKFKRKNAAVCGLMTQMLDCGVFIRLGEIHLSETKAQVANQLFETIQAIKNANNLCPDQKNKILHRLSHMVYDDACHLDELVQKNAPKHEILQFLANLTFKIDRMHVKNHVRPQCKNKTGKYNPYHDRKLDNLNSEICEQRNNCKHAIKHMDEKATLFILRMAQIHNQRLCE
jgi:hypothetical protein